MATLHVPRWCERGCACQAACIQKFADDKILAKGVEQFQSHTGAMGSQERRSYMFNIMKGMVQKDDGLRCPVQRYKFMGHDVCSDAFYILTRTSKTMISKLVASLLAGAETPPDDGRAHREDRHKPCFEIVNSFFYWVYQHMAEPLAEGATAEDVPEDMDDSTVAELEAQAASMHFEPYQEWIYSANPFVAQGIPQQEREQRWLHPMSIADLYEQFLYMYADHPDKGSVSSTVFYLCWKKNWQGTLRIHRKTQHAKCDTCIKFKKWRKDAKSEAQKSAVNAGYNTHLRSVFRDRQLGTSMAVHSEMSMAPGTTIPESGRTIYLCIDGMDKQKYQVPRNMDLGKQWESAWRPELLNTMVLCHGVADLFYVASCDQKKDSNHQLSVLTHSLQEITKVLEEKQLPLPAHISIQQDNTTREGRNQWTMLWAAHLVGSNRFRSVTWCFYQVGHTHNEVDAAFARVSHVFNTAPEPLECPEELG